MNNMKFSVAAEAIATIHSNENGSFKTLGTCFSFLKSNWYMTAKHVVVEHGLVRDELFVVTHAPNKTLGIRKKPKKIYFHEELDIAIVEMNDELCKKPHFPGHHDYVGKQGLVKLAYSPKLTKERGGVIFNATHIKDYTVETRQRNYGDEILFTFPDEYVEGGNSGAPLIGEAGNIVGIIIDGRFDSSNNLTHSVATDVQAMLSVLTLNIYPIDNESTSRLKVRDFTLEPTSVPLTYRQRIAG